MPLVVRVLATAAVCSLLATEARAQSCLGNPALPTGHLIVSSDVAIGSDFWGLGADVTYGRGRAGPFAAAGVGMRKFVSDPKETRTAFGGSIGYERYNRDQLIWCPIVTFAGERGSDVEGEFGTQRTTGTVIGVGLGVGFEIERDGPLSFNPYLSARQTRVRTNITREGGNNTSDTETGAVFAFGLGVRFNEALQITPTFSGATFPGSNLVFELRGSVALKFR